MRLTRAGASPHFVRLLTGMAMMIAATGVTGCKDSPTDSEACDLVCDIGTQQYSIAVSCESGSFTTQYNNETTEYHYSGSVRSGFTLYLNRVRTYHDSGQAYTITGQIDVDEIHDAVTYNIQAAGGAFGSTPGTCSG